MRGSLKEIDICSLLHLIALGQKTGVLLISHIGNPFLVSPEIDSQRDYNWLIFCVNGRVVYATADNGNQLERLGQHLSYYKTEDALETIDSYSLASLNPPEYAAVWQLLEKKVLSLNQGRNVVQNMTEEILFEIFSLCQGNFIFQEDLALTPELISLEVPPLLLKIGKQAQQWQEFYPEIEFFDQCLVVASESKLRSALPKKAYQNLSSWADGKTPLKKIARYLNCDLVTLTKAVYPCVQRGWIVMKNPPQNHQNNTKNRTSLVSKRVVLIDQDLDGNQELKTQFQSLGYEITMISDAIQAVSLAFQLQPDLIICNADLPSIDGYQLCSIFRNSPNFQDTSITILTEQDNFLERVKATLAGATNYWRKPLTQEELWSLLQQSDKKNSSYFLVKNPDN